METAPETPASPPAKPGQTVTIPLEEAISRPGGDITSLVLRRPQPRQLEGLSLRELVEMEAGPVMRLVPKISEPPLLFHEVAVMDVSDFTHIAFEVSNFLLPRGQRA